MLVLLVLLVLLLLPLLPQPRCAVGVGDRMPTGCTVTFPAVVAHTHTSAPPPGPTHHVQEELRKMVAEIDKDDNGYLEFPEVRCAAAGHALLRVVTRCSTADTCDACTCQFATMMARKLQEATSAEKLIESFQVCATCNVCVCARARACVPVCSRGAHGCMPAHAIARRGRGAQVFDKERSGFVSVAEFRHINELGDEKLAEETLEAMIAFADKDGVGQINYEDFVKRLVGKP